MRTLASRTITAATRTEPGSLVPRQRQTHQQLRSAHVRPAAGGRIEGGRQLVALGHDVARTSGRHLMGVAPSDMVLQNVQAPDQNLYRRGMVAVCLSR